MKWEYTVHISQGGVNEDNAIGIQRTLDAMGAEGWELINIIPQISSSSFTADLPDNEYITCCQSVYITNNLLVYKRPLTD